MQPRHIVQRRQPSGTDLIAVPRALTDLAERQAGVLSRRQLESFGMNWTNVRAAVAARRWRSFGYSVVVLHNGALSARQREWAAVLAIRKPAALAGLSSLEAAELRGFEPDLVHVLVAHDTHVRAPRWVKLHESRRFDVAHIVAGSDPPRTSAARSSIDAATWSPTPRRACAILCATVQQRLTTAPILERELRRAGHVRHVAIMRDILGDIGGGGHTLAEIDLGPLAIRAGLSPPRRQVLRREAGGRVRYLDAEFELPDGTMLAVEIDGSIHVQTESWWNDLDRQNEIVIGGRPVLRFPSLAVRLSAPRVVDQLGRMRVAHTP